MLETVPARRPREGAGARAVGRHGAAAHGRAGDPAPPVDPVPRRADRRASIPQSRIALWDILGELHREGQTILLTTHYMEEADQLCDRLAIIDHGRLLALDTPAKLKQSVGADTIVTVTSDGDLDALTELLEQKIDGVSRADRVDGTVRLHVQGSRGVLPAVVNVAEDGGFVVSDLSVARADARSRLHQPHRKGPARMTAIDTPIAARRRRTAPAARGRVVGRVPRPAAARPHGAAARTSRSSSRARSCSRSCSCSCSRTCSRKIGQGVGGSGAAAAAFSTRLVAGVSR